MKLAVVFAIVLGFTSSVLADSKVDWSDYIDKSPPKKAAPATTAKTAKPAPARAKAAPKARPAKATPKTSVAAKQAPAKRAPRKK